MRLGARDVERPGWDSLTGFGVLNVGKSLDMPAEQAADRRTRSSPTTTSCGSTGRRSASRRRRSGPAAPPRASTALLDKQEDPVDVYRIVIPARRIGQDLA